jgi:hypothetical protein
MRKLHLAPKLHVVLYLQNNKSKLYFKQQNFVVHIHYEDFNERCKFLLKIHCILIYRITTKIAEITSGAQVYVDLFFNNRKMLLRKI